MRINIIDDDVRFDQCTSCKQVLEEGWKYCPYCKTKRLICNDCGEVLDKNWKYCPQCKSIVSDINKSFLNSNEWLTNILNKE